LIKILKQQNLNQIRLANKTLLGNPFHGALKCFNQKKVVVTGVAGGGDLESRGGVQDDKALAAALTGLQDVVIGREPGLVTLLAVGIGAEVAAHVRDVVLEVREGVIVVALRTHVERPLVAHFFTSIPVVQETS